MAAMTRLRLLLLLWVVLCGLDRPSAAPQRVDGLAKRDYVALDLKRYLDWNGAMSLGVTVSTVLDLQKRIIGGQPCERPYHVKLRVAAGKSSKLCGGSLISDWWILTAAHCLTPGNMFADLSVHPGGPAQEVQITAEPVIYTDNRMRSHDIMLLQLPSPSNIPPIALPDCNRRPEMFEIAGHAATTGGPNDERKPGVSPTLHCADINVVNCTDLINTLQKDVPKAYQVKGDSGGGVVYKDMIYGVISFLGDPEHVCRKATAFMDLCNPEYAAWITQNIT